MTEIEVKALELLNVPDWPYEYEPDDHPVKVLCRAIEQHEAFKQEVSDVVEDAFGLQGGHTLHRFIIPKPKPDPLVDVLADTFGASLIDADELRTALEARGLEIREKGQ